MEGCERLSEDEVERAGDVPLIPSLPISGADGEEILRFVILGNHRDAWTFGAVDPNSGTAALLEVNPFHSLYFY
ncbi:putative glutamate carboxypeptidase [Helianthus annuus]|nr:putative glutamate carboxypeptidase [Helianthus annuus]KAJ0687242.1 putative glutamate carboxypeptidase [Helianthus annuus]